MASSLVLLPTRNEVLNLGRIVPRLSALEGVDVLVIDDASPDGTGVLAERLRSSFPRLSVLHRRKKEGLGRAYVHGFSEALRRGYSRLVTMDADLSHSPEDVPRLLAALEERDVAIGSRHIPGGGVEAWPLGRRALSRAGSVYARTLLRLPARDVTSGFRAYRAEAFAAIDLDRVAARGFLFQIEMLALLAASGARIGEVPILFRNRARGASKLSAAIVAEAAAGVVRLALRHRRGAPAAPRRVAAAPPRTVSVIIACRPGDPEPAAVRSLERWRRPGAIEILIARGPSPAAQRNKAAREATGDLLLFLDDDSHPAPDLVERYLELFRTDPGATAAGGPAVYTGGGLFGRATAAALGEPLVTGRSAARYRPLGRRRPSDERELILCNLAIQRRAFEAAGGFDESLYPNEENAFLARLAAAGGRILHDPEALVHRPAPRSPWGFLAKIFGYGRGRAAQARRAFTRVSALRITVALTALAALAGALAAAPRDPRPLLAATGLYAAWLALAAAKVARREGALIGALTPVTQALTHLAYASGILFGLLRGLPARGGEVSIEKRRLEP